MGKKPHVVDGLIHQVGLYEVFLSAIHVELEVAGRDEIQTYVETLSTDEAKKKMRGLALYYTFTGNRTLAQLTGAIREQGIAGTRKAFKLRKFRGVDQGAVLKLEKAGIATVEDMMAAGKTPVNHKLLSNQTGVAPHIILELVKLSDLSRLGGVKAVRARLYYDAGLDTPDKFADWEPEELRRMLIGFVERTGFDGIAPLPREIRNAIETARKLPVRIHY
ncbi:MAG: DUF4332 domain-containing protein [Anaerolineales bacterium]|nr:DUF4332 domain-containing protein [Anaerolineales bacterium]